MILIGQFRNTVKKGKSQLPSKQQHHPFPMPFKKIFRAVYDYEATADDELNFSEGDVLGVVGEEGAAGEEDGWVYGCNILKDPETNGFIPITYCEEVN